MTYQEWMRSWKVLEETGEEHVCSTEEFHTCDQCERASQAINRLQWDIEGIMRTLIRYHEALDEITHHVVQEVTFPREQGLQQALLKALSLLDKAKS